jgi:hypothetical protein
LQNTLPIIRGDVGNYSLKSPDLETIIKLQLSRSGQTVYSDTQLDDLLYPAFQNVISFEWSNAYTHSLYSEKLLNFIPNFYDHTRGHVTNRMLTDLIGDHLTRLLNDNQSTFYNQESYRLDNFYGNVFPIEIDGDSTHEYLLEIKDKSGYYLSNYSFWITLDRNEEGEYKRLTNQLPWISGSSSILSPDTQFLDLTGDGFEDVILLESECNLGICDQEIHIAMGEETGLYWLSSLENILDNTDLSATYWYDIKVKTNPINHLPVISLTQFRDIGWDCVSSLTHEYQWIDGQESVDIHPEVFYKKVDKPALIEDFISNENQHAKCLIAKSLDSDLSEDTTTQIHILEAGFDLVDTLSPADQVFLLYRLGLLYSLLGDRVKTKTYIDHLNQSATQYSIPIAQSLMVELSDLPTDKINPYTLCIAAEKIAIPKNDILQNELIDKRKFVYDGFNEGYSAPLCDTRDILSNFLNSLSLSSNLSLEQSLRDNSIPFRLVNQMKPEVSKTTWVVVLEEDDPFALNQNETKLDDDNELQVYLYSEDSGWQFITSFKNSQILSTNLTDLTGDEIIDFAFTLPSQTPERSLCYSDEKPIDLFLISSLDREIIISFTDTLCLQGNQSPDLSIFLKDEDGNGILEIIEDYLEEELFDLSLITEVDKSMGPTIHQIPYPQLAQYMNKDVVLTQLTNHVLRGGNLSNTIERIWWYLEIWGKDDDLGEYITAQLQYLLALSYQGIGDNNKAIKMFFNIWSNQSNTTWAHLASSHLEYIP